MPGYVFWMRFHCTLRRPPEEMLWIVPSAIHCDVMATLGYTVPLHTCVAVDKVAQPPSGGHQPEAVEVFVTHVCPGRHAGLPSKLQKKGFGTAVTLPQVTGGYPEIWKVTLA